MVTTSGSLSPPPWTLSSTLWYTPICSHCWLLYLRWKCRKHHAKTPSLQHQPLFLMVLPRVKVSLLKISHFSGAQPWKTVSLQCYALKSPQLILHHPLSPWTLSLALWIQFSTCVYFLFHFTWHPHIQMCSSTVHLTFRTQKDEPFAFCSHISSYKQIKHQTTWQRESKESPKVREGLRKGKKVHLSLPLEWLRVGPHNDSLPHPFSPAPTQELLFCSPLHQS